MTVHRELLSKNLESQDHPACDKAESRWIEFLTILNQDRVMKKHVLQRVAIGWMDGSISRHAAFHKPVEFMATTFLGLDGAAAGVIIGNLHSPGQIDHIVSPREHGYDPDLIAYFRSQGCSGVALRPLKGMTQVAGYEKSGEIAGKIAYLLDRERLTDGQISNESAQKFTTYEALTMLLTIGKAPFDATALAYNTIEFWN